MGRGIVESGLFRSERYGLEQRTSDPATTQEGDMWIRTDLAPDTDQLATLRFDAGASTWDVPIYDVAATTTNVEKVLRVPIGGTTGFVPITDDSPTFSALKFQHNGAAFGAHDALTASAIPDSGVSRWEFEEGSGTTAIDSWGPNDGTISGATYSTESAVGSFSLNFDGTDDDLDLGTPILSTTDSTQPYSISAWIYPRTVNDFSIFAQYKSTNVNGTRFIFRVNDDGTDTIQWFKGGESTYASGNTALSANTWQHVVGVKDANQDVHFYLDGSPDGSVTDGDTFAYRDVNSHIGNREDSAIADGYIDDPRIYAKALSSQEVSNLYNTGSISG